MSMENISLSGRKKQVSNKNMTLGERMYLGAIAGGMATTFKHLFKKKVTINYPEETRPFSPVYRGRHTLMRDDEGRERCTACGLCAVSCPAEAITMKAAERKPGEEHLYREEKYAEIYEINMLRCIYCGLCEEACTIQSIYLTQSKQNVQANNSRESFIFGKEQMIMSLEQAVLNTAKSE